MEIISAVISPLVQCVGPSVAKRWEYHRDIKKNMADLTESLETLKAQEAGYKRKLEAKVVSGEIEVADEVKLWLERVEKYDRDVDEIRNKVTRVKFFFRASLGKRVSEMKLEVDKHYREGEFADGDLVRLLPRRGNVKPTETILGGQTTTKNVTRILECLADENVKRIGLYGMGGIGKTTVLELVHNELLKGGGEIRSKFDKVIWITVSKDCGLKGLQDKIASKLGLDISNDEETMATALFGKFNENNKRYVLILDDMWEAYPLKKVGIPNPTPENGCKLVLTTRSSEVCSKMECDRIIEMGVLPEQEARDLFLDKVGQNVASNPELQEIVGQVARECAGLPLAIVTVAGSLRDKMDLIEWEEALDDLKDATASMSSEITAILRFSYDRLKDKNLKDCLLYCALYPEDYPIERNLLIDQLIAEAIVEETKTRQSPARKGHIMLNNLLRNCLLIDAINDDGEESVKLHDSIRDMAIQIMRESPSRFVAEARRGLESLKPEEIWNEHVEKVSLMGNEITEISFTEPPKCPRLSTLFLNHNRELEHLSEDFFLQMERLRVLDLSWTNIKRLPKSVSVLVNLAVLSLVRCQDLVHVPDLSDLRNLRRLDLWGTGITEVPKGMETMEKLTYLDLSNTELQSLPKGTLCKLSNLHFLSLLQMGFYVTAEELVNLRKLETLRVNFAKLEDFHAYVGFSNSGKLPNFFLQVGEFGYPPNFRDKDVRLSYCNINECVEGGCGFPLILPENVESLTMGACHFSVQSLCRLTSVENITNLTRLDISWCSRFKCLFYDPSAVFPLLQKIEYLELCGLVNLRGVFCTESGALAPLPSGSFSSLKILKISDCDNLKKLLVLADASLPNLEEIYIGFCEQLEEIITSNEEADDLTVNNYTVTLPKLKALRLWSLPKLKSIPFVADSLESVDIESCPELKSIFFLGGCKQLEEIITSKDEADDLTFNVYTVTLPKLKKLTLSYLPKLRSIPFVADSLIQVVIKHCPELKSIFFLDGNQCPPSLPNVEYINIYNCEQLEEIITSKEEADDLTVNNYTVTLPKLIELTLSSLPKLKSIPFVADSLESVEIESCPELKSIFFLDGDQCPPSLQSISIDEEPWKSR